MNAHLGVTVDEAPGATEGGVTEGAVAGSGGIAVQATQFAVGGSVVMNEVLQGGISICLGLCGTTAQSHESYSRVQIF